MDMTGCEYLHRLHDVGFLGWRWARALCSSAAQVPLAPATVNVFSGVLDLNGATQSITTLGLGGAATNHLGCRGHRKRRTAQPRGRCPFTATNKSQRSNHLGGTLNLGATRNFTVNDSTAAANDLTISATIAGSGFGLIKSGTGGTAAHPKQHILMAGYCPARVGHG